tara:strand:+ start:293 stop:1336 length:1044 start_codon:yes stop_codon:yes gene_type:complete
MHENQESKSSSSITNFISGIAKVGDAEGLGEFKLGDFFQEAFKSHTEEEVEQSIIVGTSTTTPDITEISITYPKPWLFFRLIIASLVLFYGFVFAYYEFKNANLLPGLIFTGSFAIPISTVFLFFELNIRKNVPLWQVMRLVLFGGILSLIFSLILFENTDFLNDSMGASVAGVVEEPAKLAALVVLMRGKRNFPYILNGLLMGAAVGCGFAAFESAGYALRYGFAFFGVPNISGIVNIIQLRGLLSPFAHIVWTAVAGAALWRVMRGRKFDFEFCKKKEFYAPFLSVVTCHAVWNSDFDLPLMGKYIALGTVAWILALSLVNLGIKQIAEEKSGKSIFPSTSQESI